MTLLVLALALSMDAFAAALSYGATTRSPATFTGALRVGFAFGAAQALMPLVGWGLGVAFATLITSADHWVAFVLLGFIGARMVYEGFERGEGLREESSSLESMGGLLLMALATSIDAAAAGVTLAFLDQSIFTACAIIGAVTLVLSSVGVLLGKRMGALFGKRAEIVGGFVLIGIGTKILIEHLTAK